MSGMAASDRLPRRASDPPRSSPPAPAWRATVAQTAMELRLTSRRGENLLVTIVIPVVLLVFFAAVSVIPIPSGTAVEFLLPGILALAVISTAMVNLGIATAYERYYGVLKRLGGSPLSRGGLVTAKALSILAIEALQVVLLVAIATLGFGWSPGPGASLPLAVLGFLLGTAAFAGIGLAMAGTLRAEATLAAANGLFLVFLLLGGIVLPIDHLPAPLEALARIMPASPLADVLRIGLGADAGDALEPLAVLTAWAIGAVAVAVRAFRWE